MIELETPYGECHCGCGGKTTLILQTNRARGLVKGQPHRFLHGHYQVQVARPRDLQERFWSKVDKSPGHGPNGDCWPWISTLRNGYGLFYRSHRSVTAHRVAFELTTGTPPPDDLDVCHHCDFPPCCRGTHLFLGTHAMNMHDRMSKGHYIGLKGSLNGYAKLTEDSVLEIRNLYATGVKNQPQLAAQFNVAQAHISCIVRRAGWRHL